MEGRLAPVFHIQKIQAFQTWPIRQAAMWPDQSLEFVKLSKDEIGIHFGLFLKAELISVISLFIDNQEAQFRKFATLPAYQGQGLGTQLLAYSLNYLAALNLNNIWCNARLEKTEFYERFGLELTKRWFHRAGIDYVVMEKKL